VTNINIHQEASGNIIDLSLNNGNGIFLNRFQKYFEIFSAVEKLKIIII
jgi:uncharacterized protein (DUF608 family)